MAITCITPGLSLMATARSIFDTSRQHRIYMACMCQNLANRGWGVKQTQRVTGLGKKEIRELLDFYQSLIASGEKLEPGGTNGGE
jgi:hypothetical protein